MNSTTNQPTIGQTITVRGILCRITVIRPFGTLDCESIDGKHSFRVSGLNFNQKA